MNEENTSFVFEVFPNPTTGNEINMNWFGESNDKITCKLIDITGKAVSLKTWFPSSESEQLSMNIDDVNPGMYLLKMDQGSRSVTSRVIINR
ncbi:MAG: T9SS type A sorting domain-containing protein [Flavobacteriales bacterium]|nr:T9SS type A sorting domain-containing protein [Flavobacteriales bacterium]